MSAQLLIAAIVLVLLAGAVELWWGSAARARRRDSLRHLEQRLAADEARILNTPATATPAAAPASREGAKQPAPQPQRRPGRWRVFAERAGLALGPRLLLLAIVPGLLLMGLAAWRVQSLWAALAAGVLYIIVLGLWLMRRIDRQQRLMTHQLPDFLDNVVRMISIGHSLPMAFHGATDNVAMPLRGVLDHTMQRMRAGMELDEALRQSGRIHRIEALELLQAVIGMSMRYGGRTDQVLQRVSDFMRDLEQAQQELKSVTSETRMSSWVLGLLPILVGSFMMLANPGFFTPVFHVALGHKLLLIALCLELLGAFLLYRLARSI